MRLTQPPRWQLVAQRQLTGSGTSAAITDGSYGVFTFARSGTDGTVTWAFALTESTVQGLGKDDTATATAYVRINDGDADSSIEVISITITGTEDKPILSANHDGCGYGR